MNRILLIVGFILCITAAQLDQTIACLKTYTETFKPKLSQDLYRIFSKSFPNTMETTVNHYTLTPGNEQTYIITGDIEAMWLRDSTNQFLPYIRMPIDCPHVQSLAKGLINTQAEMIMIDAYTNAFKKYQKEGNRPFYLKDKTYTLIFGLSVDLCRERQFATKSIWQRKFQIDSLASFLRLSYEYVNKYKTIDFINLRFFKALKRILTVIDEQTKDESYQLKNNNYYYLFFRDSRQLPQGKIRPSKRTGMVKTGFRPSDDPNQLAYNIPGNAMLATYLKLVAEVVLAQVPQNSIFKSMSITLSQKMILISDQIKAGIEEHGVVMKDGNQIYAYEVSGFGDYRTYDDANLPSLLSLAYMEFTTEFASTYKNTRQFILSPKNIYYYANGNVAGIGSSHTNFRYIWPLALITQILTSQKDNQIRFCLQILKKSAVDNLMHESFSVDNPISITRSWFAWANSYFGEMIIKLSLTKQHLLK